MVKPEYSLDELDKICAELVMGWEKLRTGSHGQLLVCNEHGVPTHAWAPTRNIAQAWECLEKIGLGADILCCFKNAKTASGKSFLCRLLRNEETIDETAQSAPEAIVRACLKAKGVEIS